MSGTDQPHTTTKVPVKVVVAAPERTSAAIRFIGGLAARSCAIRHRRIAKTAVIQRSMTKIESPDQLTDTELLAQVTRAAKQERAATAHLIALLAEVDARRLYLGEGYSSLFTYCTQALHLSEHAAYGRIEAARAARRFPVVMGFLADGSLNVTTIGLLAPHLTDDNHQTLLVSARYKSKRDVERMVAALRPLPAVPSSVRKLPAPVRPAGPQHTAERDDRAQCSFE